MESGAPSLRPEHELARNRLAYLEAALRAAERRDEVMRVVGDAEDPSIARAHVAELLTVSPQQAEGVLDLRLTRFTRRELAALRTEREQLLASFGED